MESGTEEVLGPISPSAVEDTNGKWSLPIFRLSRNP